MVQKVTCTANAQSVALISGARGTTGAGWAAVRVLGLEPRVVSVVSVQLNHGSETRSGQMRGKVRREAEAPVWLFIRMRKRRKTGGSGRGHAPFHLSCTSHLGDIHQVTGTHPAVSRPWAKTGIKI